MITVTNSDTEQLVADLAWDFCENTRNGQPVVMQEYLDRCPDAPSRNHFKALVNTDLLLRATVATEVKGA